MKEPICSFADGRRKGRSLRPIWRNLRQTAVIGRCTFRFEYFTRELSSHTSPGTDFFLPAAHVSLYAVQAMCD